MTYMTCITLYALGFALSAWAVRLDGIENPPSSPPTRRRRPTPMSELDGVACRPAGNPMAWALAGLAVSTAASILGLIANGQP